MLEFLQKYNGTIKLNNNEILSENFNEEFSKTSGPVEIFLIPKNVIHRDSHTGKLSNVQIYVKPWMLEKGNRNLSFMSTWNNDIPMPLRYMVGTVEKETSRMYYMNLHGDLLKTVVCVRCGRTLVNTVSKMCGIGPECLEKTGVDPKLLLNELAVNNNLDKIKERLQQIKWKGWVPKTAILELKNC